MEMMADGMWKDKRNIEYDSILFEVYVTPDITLFKRLYNLNVTITTNLNDVEYGDPDSNNFSIFEGA